MLGAQQIKSEKGLRDLIARNLRKEIHPGTKSSIDFIKKILDEAYESGMEYDVSDLYNKILAFGNNSSNQALACLKLIQEMKFKSETISEAPPAVLKDERYVFWDVEVYPNLFVICWKFAGDANMVKMINPSAQDVEQLFSLKLIGFHNRQYDNHILYARLQGYSNEELYKLSQKIISGNRGSMFGAAYNISYADVYDFSSKKQGLKKFMIELGLNHMEMDIPWDQPVPPELVDKVVEYCSNDVIGTEATFNARKQDFVARQILADLSGLAVNDTTQKHTAKIIFGDDRNPQRKFVYTLLEEEFPGYKYEMGKSHYKGEVTGEGGYVYAEPGMYENVAVLDIASMHPTSIEQLNLFGDEYTANFSALKAARIAIKRGNYAEARKMLGGKLAPHLEDPEEAQALSYALKIVINIVYGLTSARFENPFKDPKNKDNIVAKRGALFMIDLKQACQEKGLQVVHIKTDSIKIPNAKAEDISEIMAFGAKYGYEFEYEGTYDRFCLVNDAVYIARKRFNPRNMPDDGMAHVHRPIWEAVGAQFQHPYVYKTLFSGEPIEFDDLCETKQVTKGAMYLDYENDRPKPTPESMRFVGRIGRFIPVREGVGGASLYRVNDDKLYAVSGTKGYMWLEADMANHREDLLKNELIDMGYFENLAHEAICTIEKFGDFEAFVS